MENKTKRASVPHCTQNGIKTAVCFKCGMKRVASINRNINKTVSSEIIEMYKMTYGKHKGLFRCKDCKEGEQSYKLKGVWYVYYHDKQGNQTAPCGNSNYKVVAREHAKQNTVDKRYEIDYTYNDIMRVPSQEYNCQACGGNYCPAYDECNDKGDF